MIFHHNWGSVFNEIIVFISLGDTLVNQMKCSSLSPMNLLRIMRGIFCQRRPYPNKEFIKPVTDQLFVSSEWTIMKFKSSMYRVRSICFFAMPFKIFIFSLNCYHHYYYSIYLCSVSFCYFQNVIQFIAIILTLHFILCSVSFDT